MTKVIAIANDSEFTSWDKIGGDILTSAYVEILEDYTLGREAVFYSAPTSTKYFTKGAEAIHGFSYFKAQTFPSRRWSCLAAMEWLKPLMDDFPLPFIFHGNGDLDHGWNEMHFQKEELQGSFLKAFPKEMIESTLKMARKELKSIQEPTIVKPDGKLVGKFSLPNIAQYYNLELNHHDSLSEARVCAQIYCNIKLKKGTWTGELF